MRNTLVDELNSGIGSFDPFGLYKISSRSVRNSLSLSRDERDVFLFILDRTIGWKKVWECFPMREFVHGVYRGRPGRRRLVTASVDLRPEAIAAALAALKSVGAIEPAELAPDTCYRIVEDWTHPNLLGRGRNAMWEVNEADRDYPWCEHCLCQRCRRLASL